MAKETEGGATPPPEDTGGIPRLHEGPPGPPGSGPPVDPGPIPTKPEHPPDGGGPGGGPGGGGDSLDIGDDPEAGPEPTDADFAKWEEDYDHWASGDPTPLAATSYPGQIIGTPGVGTHSFTDPPNNWQSDNAIDIWLYPGTAVVSPVHGVVSSRYGYGLMQSGSGRFAGSRLHVEGDDGHVTFYTHMRKLMAHQGQRVAPGDLLGWSGIANGVPHLHFAIQLPFNPVPLARKVVNLHWHQGGVKPPPGHGPNEPPPPASGPHKGHVEDAWRNVHGQMRLLEQRGAIADGFSKTLLTAVKPTS